MGKKNTCQSIIKGLDALVQLGIFICVCILCSLSSKEPFKSHIIGDINNYFYESSISTDKQCICSNFTFNHTCTEEELSQGCEDISLDKLKINHSFLRKLVSDSFCDDQHDSFVRNKDKKISYLFDLNYGLIRKFSITLLVLTLSNIPLTILFIFIFKCSKTCAIFISLLAILVWIARIVISILLFYNVENGDIQKYDDFLDCKNVKTKYFDKFSDITKLRKCFLAFAVFSIISEVLGKLGELCEIPDDD